jgi:hypothetical protein
MAARTLDWYQLAQDQRARLRALLDEPLILRDPLGAAGLWWWLLAALGVGGFAIFFACDLGVVTSPWHGGAPLVLGCYFVTAAFGGYGVIRGLRAVARQRRPWPAGRWLSAHGFLDTRGALWRVRSIADLDGCEVDAKQSDVLVAITFRLRFGDESEEFLLVTGPAFVEKHVPREALAGLERRRDELRAKDRAALAREDPLSEAALPSARAASGDPERRYVRRARLGALALALGVTALLHTLVLPLRSLAASASATGFRAVAAAYPYGWVRARARVAIHERYQASRRAIEARPEPARSLLRTLLDWSERNDRPELRLSLSAPPNEEVERATNWLKARVEPGARAAPVILYHAAVSLADVIVGEEELRRALANRLDQIVKSDVLVFDDQRTASAPEPTIAVVSSVTAGGVLSGQGRARFAALAFSYRASLVLPGAPPAPLGSEVHVPPPSHVEVGRLTFGNEKLPPLGEGDAAFLEDSMLYTNEASEAAKQAGDALAAQLLP